jgi:hypothetical protein
VTIELGVLATGITLIIGGLVFVGNKLKDAKIETGRDAERWGRLEEKFDGHGKNLDRLEQKLDKYIDESKRAESDRERHWDESTKRIHERLDGLARDLSIHIRDGHGKE